MSPRGWIVLKLLRPCERCKATNVRVFENAVSGERRCTECLDRESVVPQPSEEPT
jgi:hypothetical protein